MGGEGNFEDKSAVSSAPFTPYCSLLRLQLIIPLWILFTFVLDFPDIPCDFLGQQGVPQQFYQWVILSRWYATCFIQDSSSGRMLVISAESPEAPRSAQALGPFFFPFKVLVAGSSEISSNS